MKRIRPDHRIPHSHRLGEVAICRSSRRAGNAAASGQRRGATLTEVLMALLIMSVGVISVFSLYPIAVLRSIQATQLTNSKILSENAENELLGDPALLNGAPYWRPNTPYRLGDVIVAPPNAGELLSKSAFRFVCTNPGTSGSEEPNFELINPANSDFTDNTNALFPGTGLPGAFLEDRDTDGAIDGGEVVWQRAAGDVLAAGTSAPSGAAYPLSTPTRLLQGAGSPSVTVTDPLGWTQHHATAANAVAGGSAITAPAVATALSLRDSYGAAPRLSGGMGELFDNGDGVSRSMAFLSGSAITVEDTYRPLFGTGAGGFNAVVDNEELTAAQLSRVARSRVDLPVSYVSTLSSVQPTSVVTDPTVVPPTTTITLPVSPESVSLLAGLQSTLTSLEAASQPQLVRLVLEGRSAAVPGAPTATVQRWLTAASITPATGTIVVGGVFPQDFGFASVPTTAAFNLTGATATSAVVTAAHIEINESRFSWLATIARDSNGAISHADCAVFFRRQFGQALEQGFECAIGNDPSVAGPGAAADSRGAWIRTIDSGAIAEAAIGRPLFDSVNGIWYEINSIVATGAGPDGNITVVTLDRDVEVEVSNDGMWTAGDTRGVIEPQAVIPRGVVRVFPLKLRR